MDSLGTALKALVWFIYQGVIVGGLGAVYFVIPFVCLVALMWKKFPRGDRRLQKRLIGPVVLMPLIWITIGLLGGLYWVDWQHHAVAAPNWVRSVVTFGPPAALGVAIISVLLLKGTRVFIASYALVNLYLTVSTAFMSTMAVTGDWL
jgi:hypothetical protein